MEKHAIEILSTADTVIWGRGTYQGMHSYWPSVPLNPSASQHERNHAEWIEKTAKIVFSKTLEKAEWNNSRLVKENVHLARLTAAQFSRTYPAMNELGIDFAVEIKNFKQQAGVGI